MKKKILLQLLTISCAMAFAFGTAACGETSSTPDSSGTENSSMGDSSVGIGGELIVPEEPDALTEPNLKDRTVYKNDKPEAFYIGKGNLVSLTVGGTALAKTDYVINGGWLILRAESWGEVGLGLVAFVFEFENYDAITVNVTISNADETPTIPGGALSDRENFALWTANSAVELSYEESDNAIVLKKTSDKDDTKTKENMVFFNADYIRLADEYGAACIQFEYKANDILAGSDSASFRFYATETVASLTGGFDSFEATTEWQTATIDIEQFFVANSSVQYFGIVLGGAKNSTLSIKNWRVETREKLNEYRVSSLLPNYGFSEDNISKWFTANSSGLKLGWDNEKGMSLTAQMANSGLWTRDTMVYTPATFLRIAQSAGYQGVSFSVKADDEFASYVPGSANGIALGKGIRVVSKMVDGRDDNRIMDGMATGIYQYGDFGTESGISEFTVTISLDSFFALNPDMKYLGLVVGSPAGSSFYLSDLKLIEGQGGTTPEPDPDIPEVEKSLLEKYGFSQKNTPSTASGGIWDVNSGGVMGKSWDAATNSMKVSMSNANAQIAGRDFVTYTSIDMLKDTKDAGYAKVSFKVSSTDGAMLDAGRGLRVYSKTTAGRAGDGAGVVDSAAYGTYVYGDFGLEAGTTEITVVIDIEEFLALNVTANYIGIVVNIPINTSVYFSELQFLNN